MNKAILAALLLAPLAASAAEAPLPDLSWRLLGPFRAGWATVAAGIPDQPDTFYFGGAGGGVWKTTNDGRTWSNVSDAAGIVSVGAIAIAPSNPNIVYVGSGQSEPRYDIAAGDGVYRSSDGGKTWQHVGLEQVRHIARIVVDPRNPDIVTVAAIGHLFGEDGNRGVYHSTDGGKTWKQALAIDERTGVADIAADPNRPAILYAAAWQARDWPWLSYFTPMVGAGSGLYKSIDGGANWVRLSDAEGWPQGALGRITLAVTDIKHGARIYATIDEEKIGGLWRSDDDGKHWQRVNEDADKLAGWYFSRLVVASDNPDVVYSAGRSILKSTDAGRTFTEFRGAPGGDDYHDLWINPKHPERMITGSDQGAIVSIDGGKSWGDWYNQPTGQFYHLAADNRFPYWVYSGQQDSGTVAIASRSDYGAISFRDWHPVGADERDYDIPDPENPDIVYGSGLGGDIRRWDARTGQSADVTPWPVKAYGKRPTTVKYRYTWITPLAASAKAPYAIYTGAQVLFRTRDRGKHWDVISPDLTGKQEGAKNCEGNVAIADAKACGYGVIYTIAPSPHGNDEIWIGTDNGLVQLTRDGGKHWSDVTPKDLPAWSRIDSIDVSALDPGTAYVVADNHRQDDFRPYAWRTRDYGKTWQRIESDLPADHFLAVLRADPAKRGLLYAGTDTSVFVSLDDGAHWRSLQQDLPHAWVRDLLVKEDDLIAATQGRAIWVLDNLSPLRQMRDEVVHASAHLFTPAPAYRLRMSNNHDTPPPPETALGENPPIGAVIDYWLGADAGDVVKLRILDGSGKPVREFASTDTPEKLTADRYFTVDWIGKPNVLSAAPGMHRFVWDLHHARPRTQSYEYSIAAVYGRGTPILPEGPFVVPGNYTVVLLAGGKEIKQTLTVKLDPRVKAKPEALRASLEFSRDATRQLEKAFLAGGEIDALRKQLEALKPKAKGKATLEAAMDDLSAKTEPIGKKKEGRESDFATIGAAIAVLETDIEASDVAPTAAQRAVLEHFAAELRKSLATWSALRQAELAKLDAELKGAGLPPIALPRADEIESDAPGSKDLP
jgi:photosystem II stability/assembly factor-like uncharacterized protein